MEQTIMIKQQKAKYTITPEQISTSELVQSRPRWIVSPKYDGYQIYIQILWNKEKQCGDVMFWTSSGKQFNLESFRVELKEYIDYDTPGWFFTAEYMYDCEGLLGDRANSAKINTLVTNYKHGRPNAPELESKSKIRVFDCMFFDEDGDLEIDKAEDRQYMIRQYDLADSNGDCNIQPIGYETVHTKDVPSVVKGYLKQGYEGAMLLDPDSMYMPGKRVPHLIKVKRRLDADLRCVGIKPGAGKYEGLIGALLLEDDQGRQVSVGTGLTDNDRARPHSDYIDKIIEIQYERIAKTYIQPAYICIREDKS